MSGWQASPRTSSATCVWGWGELTARSDVLRSAWSEHVLYEKAMDHKLLRRPRVGSLALDQHVLELPGSEGHRIWAFHPSDEATSNALLRLAPVALPFGRPSPAAVPTAS
ncbi:hypothetical protein ACFT9I_02355 [Streptomyces sp. NPDC057137]|uniref:MmyB family transcriptional regulator n=1 Tax=Streptomyces sp. NPDC057137 TaxID=3346030 RepID=UPI00362ADFCF